MIRVTIVLNHIRGVITLLITTHAPPSREGGAWKQKRPISQTLTTPWPQSQKSLNPRGHGWGHPSCPIKVPIGPSSYIQVACKHTEKHDIRLCMLMDMHTNACMHACMHACIHTYVHAYIHTYIHACMHPSIHPSIHPSMHACMHACMCALCMRTCICVCRPTDR